MARARQIARALGCAAALAGLSGCDIVQGFKDAGDALFPPVKTYLDVPGFRLVSGGYSYLDMLTSSEPYILARSANPDDDSLYAMRFQAPHPCRIPDVTSYWSDGPDDAERTYIAYFDGTGSGTLHFTDMECRQYEFVLEDSNLPSGYTEGGLIVVAGGDLLAVDPEAGTTKVLASGVEEIASGHLVRASGQLGVFDRDWTLISWMGDGVKRVTTAFGAVYFEDTAGIHRLSVTSAPDASATESLVVPDACHLSVIPGTPYLELLSFYSPCADQTLAVWDAQTRKTTALPLPALPEYLKIAAARTPEVLDGHHPNLAEDPYWALYLTDLDAPTATGTLVVHTPAGDELTLGEGAALERVELKTTESNGDYTGGFALLDTQSGQGRFVRWDASGTVTDLASDVVRQPANPTWNRLVIGVDERRADLAEIVNGELVLVAHDVPRGRYAYTPAHPVDEFKGKMAWFSEYDGNSGTLSLAAPNPRLPGTDDQRGGPPYSATPIAHGVYVNRHGFMNDLPGFVYLTRFDDTIRTGQLNYTNTELGFSAIVSDGVADYEQPGSGLLYSIPYGEGAGIWLARAK